jgi:hypothetical protein
MLQKPPASFIFKAARTLRPAHRTDGFRNAPGEKSTGSTGTFFAPKLSGMHQRKAPSFQFSSG